MYLGLKHFRIPPETALVMSNALSDAELRSLHVPTLLLFGEREVIYGPAAALIRARRLVPDLDGELVPASSHDMCFRQHQIVDARVLDFLKETRPTLTERVVA
jgi:pimeloyl-ACP methyl ester carboxylesterase